MNDTNVLGFELINEPWVGDVYGKRRSVVVVACVHVWKSEVVNSREEDVCAFLV